jgi:hypothetical protein
MIVVLAISLFTTRIILINLGVEDYGIYNVVGSIVSLFTFLQTAISSANYRYLAFAIGKQDKELFASTFKTAIILSIVISVFIIILAETVGIFYIKNYLNVPDSRFKAAYYTFQISAITCVITTLYMPFYSNVISQERMDFFAYLSIFEAFSKIAIAIAIAYAPIDHLIFYASLLLLSQFGILIAYFLFTITTTSSFRVIIKAKISKYLIKDMAYFSSWTLFVAIADLCTTQGINIVINYFFSPIVNAARGIAVQIQGAVDQFRGNLQTAFNPQITKRYASDNLDGMFDLMTRSARYSSYILLIISIPITFSVDTILTIWLKEVPTYTNVFVIITLTASIIDGISNPFVTAISATGSIKKFQSLVGIMKFTTLPVCYIAALTYTSPITIFLVYLIFTLFTVVLRIWICANKINMSFNYILVNILLPILKFSVISVIVCSILKKIIDLTEIISLVSYEISSVLIIGITSYYLVLSTGEKQYIIGYIKKKFHVN